MNERLRYYRYGIGQRFEWHYDGYFERPAVPERSRLTFMIYLNDGFVGGETSFTGLQNVPSSLQIAPVCGTALFFVHRLLHKGEPVVEGCKYVLRTDVMYRS